MYPRNIDLPVDHSFFLFGPRGTGKSTLIRSRYPHALYIDLLDFHTYQRLLADPGRLFDSIPKNHRDFIILDEVQRIPELLNEIHRLIESPAHYKFIMTGSSARKLRRQGTNLLAGRAYTYRLYPLSADELGSDFSMPHALHYGSLPATYKVSKPDQFLRGYVTTYLKEEIIQEGLTRNLTAFAKFLEVASFSVGSPINTSAIAREVSVDRKVVENYFTILEDLMLGFRLPVFTRRAKRKLVHHPKFYFFDTGVYQTVRPTGPLDTLSEINGPALENLFFQNLLATNENLRLGYQFSYFRTINGQEIDVVAYGSRGFHAFEIKLGTGFTPSWTRALQSFSDDYPEAKLYLLYTGSHTLYHKNITVLPFGDALRRLSTLLA